MLGVIASYAPGIEKHVIARGSCSPPADFEREYRMTGGHWHHGELGFDQLFMLRPVPGATQYATPMAGLYLCGAGTHPGGGVMGVAGMNAARQVMLKEATHERGHEGPASRSAHGGVAHAFSFAHLALVPYQRLGRWAGYTTVQVFTDVELEYFAVRNASTLFDLSPMVKYRIEGPDATRYLNRLVTRDVAKLRPGRVAYVPSGATTSGKVLDDGTSVPLERQRVPPLQSGTASLLAAGLGNRIRCDRRRRQ